MKNRIILTRMQLIVLIVLGTFLGLCLRHRLSSFAWLPSLTLWLLFCTIFLMGLEVPLSTLQPVFILRAVGLSMASITGSVLCLRFILFLRTRHAKSAHHR